MFLRRDSCVAAQIDRDFLFLEKGFDQDSIGHGAYVGAEADQFNLLAITFFPLKDLTELGGA